MSSSIADIGGLVARGEGTAAGKPKLAARLKLMGPTLLADAGGGGLEADPAGGGGIGPPAAPVLNSAQRGHFLLVSGDEK